MELHEVVRTAKSAIERHALLLPGDKVIVGLSGGADSTALLCVLKKLGYDCVAAHCNYHLRGNESDRDEAHARATALRLGVRFRSTDFDVAKEVTASPRPISTEMACRNLRYDWFDTLRREEKAAATAVAHHSHDNIETTLLNLFRGSGLSGLRGMRPENDRHVIRPLLNVSRSAIEDFLEAEGIDFVTDSTNRQCDYRRNRIRNRILPTIERDFPGACAGILKTIEHLNESDYFLLQAIDEKRKIYRGESGEINIGKLITSEPSAPYLLYMWLKSEGLSRRQTDSILCSAGNSGLIFKGRKSTFLLDRGILRQIHEDFQLPEFDDLYEVVRTDGNRLPEKRDKMEVYIDAAALTEGSLSVRTWANGDRIDPFGMRGSKAVSDIFSDAKIPVDAKKHWPILTLNEKILWVTGLRASRMFPVTNSTTSYLTIRYIGSDLPV